MSDRPDPRPDPEPERAPGGKDAMRTAQSDVGAGTDESLLTPDPPAPAQQDTERVPDEIKQPERPEPEEQATDNTDEPSA